MKKVVSSGVGFAVLVLAFAGVAAADDPTASSGGSGATGATGQVGGPTGATGIVKGGTHEGASALDQHWLNAAASGDIYEVTVGKLAQQRAGAGAVKRFGAMLVKDHTTSLRDTNGVAKKLGLKLQSRPNPLQQQVIALLSTMTGSRFDAFLTRISVGDHRLAITEARETANNGLARDVRRLARKEQPTLRRHLREAARLAKSASAGSTSDGNP